MMTDAGVGAEVEGGSLTFAQPGGLNGSSVELCENAVTPAGSDRKDSCGLDDEPGSSTVNNTEHTQTSITTDPFGSGCMDYVEEEVMEKTADPGSSNHHEDATDLICGLIGELSSLNTTENPPAPQQTLCKCRLAKDQLPNSSNQQHGPHRKRTKACK
ncbi:hypothetical protein INR49_026476 [Caranx melampygus]|nr:hypothetical protein INR49_026476 [Caranx melampygus]